jgi:hypothetical protein
MYFATHFHNFYHDAPLPKVERYVEDLALWGCNALSVWFDMHHYSSMTDPQARAMVKRLRAILSAANRVGMQAAFTLLSNESFANSPKELRADWTSGHDGYFQDPGAHYHLELCPHKPGGLKKILEYRDSMLKAFAGIDIGYVWLWPYDQGGCTCSACTPWGANGHMVTSEAVAKLVKKHFPKSKIVLSTWYFDHFINGEWKAFAQNIKNNKPKWIDYLMADDNGSKFPEYILKHGVPGKYPLITFAEISMHGMFPWGGFGANPQLHHFQGIWNQCRALVAGGFPYSEGIFEDINKAIQFQFGWDSSRKASDILHEYVAYEFAPAAAAELVHAAELMEDSQNHHTDFTNAGTLYAAKPANWKQISAKGRPFVSVHDLHGNSDGIAYLANKFRVTRDGKWTLLLGHDGGTRVFLDGKPVFCEPLQQNPAEPDRSRVAVNLTAGTHEIIIALDTNQGRGWGIFTRFERPASSPKGSFPKLVP